MKQKRTAIGENEDSPQKVSGYCLQIIVNFIGEAEQWTPIRLIELLLENHT